MLIHDPVIEKMPQTLPDVEPVNNEILPAEPNFEFLGEEEFVAEDEGVPEIEIPGYAVRGPAVRAPIIRKAQAPREPRAPRASTPFRQPVEPTAPATAPMGDNDAFQNLMDRFGTK